MKPSLYTLGAFLISFGALLSPLSFFLLQSVPLTSLGLATLILGISAIMLPEEPIPKREVIALFKDSMRNFDLFFEEVGPKGRAIYLPGVDTVYVFVPFTREAPPVKELARAPKRIITEATGRLGLMLLSPIAEMIRDLEGGLEETLRELIVEKLELAEGLKLATAKDEFIIEFEGLKIREGKGIRRSSAGSICTIISASLIAKLTKFSLRLAEEREEKGKLLVRLLRHE